MIPVWLTSNVLWASLIILLASAIWSRPKWAGPGWILFGLYWIGQPGHYIMEQDYYNAALTLVAAGFSFYIAWMILAKGGSKACSWLSYAAGICGIIYYPFAELAVLNSWLVGMTTLITARLLEMASVPVSVEGWNTMALNGISVEIILACTAIESIALFAGIILSVNAPLGRRIKALAISTLTIYGLNIIRNAFVLVAYGEQWFGADSFFMAHNVIAKIGSTAALMIIAYAVLTMLPELLAMIDELAMDIRRHGGDAA
ncbi:MAG TPA: archaeosortase A [Methanotrichaceae archaeon]|nr:archaeosortase A [Methanotrichaceae archaeon]